MVLSRSSCCGGFSACLYDMRGFDSELRFCIHFQDDHAKCTLSEHALESGTTSTFLISCGFMYDFSYFVLDSLIWERTCSAAGGNFFGEIRCPSSIVADDV